MTRLREELKNNYLYDYTSYPATHSANFVYNEDEVWVGLIISNEIILDIKWKLRMNTEQPDMIALSRKAIGKTLAEFKKEIEGNKSKLIQLIGSNLTATSA